MPSSPNTDTVTLAVNYLSIFIAVRARQLFEVLGSHLASLSVLITSKVYSGGSTSAMYC